MGPQAARATREDQHRPVGEVPQRVGRGEDRVVSGAGRRTRLAHEPEGGSHSDLVGDARPQRRDRPVILAGEHVEDGHGRQGGAARLVGDARLVGRREGVEAGDPALVAREAAGRVARRPSEPEVVLQRGEVRRHERGVLLGVELGVEVRAGITPLPRPVIDQVLEGLEAGASQVLVAREVPGAVEEPARLQQEAERGRIVRQPAARHLAGRSAGRVARRPSEPEVVLQRGEVRLRERGVMLGVELGVEIRAGIAPLPRPVLDQVLQGIEPGSRQVRVAREVPGAVEEPARLQQVAERGRVSGQPEAGFRTMLSAEHLHEGRRLGSSSRGKPPEVAARVEVRSRIPVLVDAVLAEVGERTTAEAGDLGVSVQVVRGIEQPGSGHGLDDGRLLRTGRASGRRALAPEELHPRSRSFPPIRVRAPRSGPERAPSRSR